LLTTCIRFWDIKRSVKALLQAKPIHPCTVLTAIKNTIMKKSILTIAIASVLISCNSKPANDVVTVKQSTTDTAGISEFEKWKDQQELIAENKSFETAAPVEETQAAVAPKVIYRNAPAKQASVARVTAPARKSTAVRKPVSRPKANTSSSGGSGNNESTAGAGTGSAGSGSGASTPAETQEEKKEGWSKAAKGTAIGGASGAVIGAVISKDKKGKGAVIGAVIGAAGGYVLGRAQDKKDGRY
jgi:hypothetical protein